MIYLMIPLIQEENQRSAQKSWENNSIFFEMLPKKMRASHIVHYRLPLNLMKTFLMFLIPVIFCLLFIFCVVEFLMMFLFAMNMIVTHIPPPPPPYQVHFAKRTFSGSGGLQVANWYKQQSFENPKNSIEPQPKLDASKSKATRKMKFPKNISMRKLWIRISDEVFVYSAHLDTRNFTSRSMPPTTNNLATPASVSPPSSPHEEQFELNVDDSDKLKRVILVRVVGMKAVPPLREFIKTGKVLDWFRLKHEMEFSQKYECRLFFPQKAFLGASSGKLDFIKSTRLTYTVIEEGVKIYAGCYYNCYFEIEKKSSILNTENLQIALYPKNVADYPTKLIDVSSLMLRNAGRNFIPRSLGVCVRPLFGPFDDLLKLLQFTSYYHAMGVTNFNFYMMSISPEIRKYLMKLSQISREIEGESLPRFILNDWNLPTGNTSELWDYGTLAALNDCLFTNVDQEFLLFVDMDEFIVPQKKLVHHQSPLWSIIDSYNSSGTYQYLLRNTFFCHEFCEQELGKNRLSLSSSPPEIVENSPISSVHLKTTDIDPLQLHIFRCTSRTKRIWSAAMRSKFIVNPRQVLAVGHHLVTKYVDIRRDFRFASGYSVQVDPSIGVMNHYRECGSISSKKHPILDRVKERDETILRFQREVNQSMHKYFLPFNLGDS